MSAFILTLSASTASASLSSTFDEIASLDARVAAAERAARAAEELCAKTTQELQRALDAAMATVAAQKTELEESSHERQRLEKTVVNLRATLAAEQGASGSMAEGELEAGMAKLLRDNEQLRANVARLQVAAEARVARALQASGVDSDMAALQHALVELQGQLDDERQLRTEAELRLREHTRGASLHRASMSKAGDGAAVLAHGPAAASRDFVLPLQHAAEGADAASEATVTDGLVDDDGVASCAGDVSVPAHEGDAAKEAVEGQAVEDKSPPEHIGATDATAPATTRAPLSMSVFNAASAVAKVGRLFFG
jgi:hypothetical protein